VQCDEFSLVLLNRFDVVLDHAIWLGMEGYSAYLVHFLALQNLPLQTGLDVPALVTT
jgi:hypothetical protein